MTSSRSRRDAGNVAYSPTTSRKSSDFDAVALILWFLVLLGMKPMHWKNNMLMPYDVLWHNKRKSLSLRNKPWFSRIYDLSTRISTRKPQNSCDFGAFSFTFYHPPINAFVRRLMWSACLFMMSSFSSTSSCNCSTLRNSSACWSHWYTPQMLV